MDKEFVDKKEKFADLLEEYIKNKDKESLLSSIKEYEKDNDFMDKELFANIIKEIKNNLDDLSNQELKQRVLLVRSYL